MKPPPILEPDQQSAIDRVQQGENVYITGKAGSGKSLVVDQLRETLGDLSLSRDLVVWEAVLGEEVAEFHRRLELGRDSAAA
jgi:ABC-type glutathione transport system ATPase component